MLRKRIFNPERPVYVRERIRFGDELVQVGELLDWRARGLSETDVRRWFNIRYLSHFKEGDFSKEAQDEYHGRVPPWTPPTPQESKRSRKRA